MKKQIQITKHSKIGDSTYVQLLTVKRKMNKGKGYSISLVNSVKKGNRNNEDIQDLFLEVIENRNQLLK